MVVVTLLTCFRLHGRVKVPRKILRRNLEIGNGKSRVKSCWSHNLGMVTQEGRGRDPGVGPVTENHHGRGCIMTPVPT